jgi:hypothetical protein
VFHLTPIQHALSSSFETTLLLLFVVIVLISKLMTKNQKCFGSPKKLKRGTYQNHLPIIIKVKKENPQTSSQGWGELVAKIG